MPEPLLAATVRLTTAAEALAALAAHVRIQTEGLTVDPELAALLAAIATELTGTAQLDPQDPGPQAVGMARAFLREATALIDDPDRRGDWSATDPAVLQGVGRLSMAIAPVIALAAERLTGLAGALARSPAAILDVGTGTGWLAIALARAFPAARVVGIDLFEPALALARQNLIDEDITDRVELRSLDAGSLDDEGAFDAIWLPLPFLARDLVPQVIARTSRALRPGRWLLPGTFAGPDDPLARLLTDLRIRRSGGHPWTTDELLQQLTANGLTDAQEIPRTWPAPVRLFAARRPTS